MEYDIATERLKSQRRIEPERHRPSIVLIWSDEHKAWWRPDAAGYTTVRDNAGRYHIEDARKRTAHCDPEKGIRFHVAALDEVVVK
jgi:hypothetical protein